MPATPRQRLSGRRLKAARDFARLKAEGQRLPVGCLILNWTPAVADRPARLGVITSRKVGGAVQRNRARRLLREAFRRHQCELARPADMVLVARNSIAGKSQAEVDRSFMEALRRSGLLRPAAGAVVSPETKPS